MSGIFPFISSICCFRCKLMIVNDPFFSHEHKFKSIISMFKVPSTVSSIRSFPFCSRVTSIIHFIIWARVLLLFKLV